MNPHNKKSPGCFYPESPIIGRFVSPWDTSGWYSVYAGFGEGAKLHSNESVTAVSVPARYQGADYIMTFNSRAEGFDDKQEVDFFCERDAVVAVALDERLSSALPSFLSEFMPSEETIAGSDGRVYLLFERRYEKGEHVHIPGISGDCNHFVVLAIPAVSEEKKTLPNLPPVLREPLAPYEKRSYKSYLAEVFNGEDSLSRGLHDGCVLETRKDNPHDRYVRMGHGSVFSRELTEASARIVVTAKIGCSEGILSVAVLGETGVICGAVLDGGMLRTMDGTDMMPYEPGHELSLRLVLDADAGKYDIWADSRMLCRADVLSDRMPLSVSVSCDGEGSLDNLYVFDDTEIYVAREEFDGGMGKMMSSDNASCTLEADPFDDDKSFSIASSDGNGAYAEYVFSAVSGILSVETKVRADNEHLVLVPEITDDKGKPICRIALYKNCLFATNGEEWVELYEGLTDWQYYPCGNWYAVKVTLDTVHSVYTLMVDGAVRAKDFRFLHSVESVSRLVFFADGGTRLLVNRIRIYDACDFSRGVLPNAPVFDVTEAPYYAVGDGKTLDTAAIQRAVNDAAYTGGTVYLHDGVFLSGEISLTSDITFFIDTTATLLGTQDHGEYPLKEPRTSLCAHRQLGRGLLYGENISNVRITGGGMLDGNGRYRFKMNDPAHDRRELDARPDLVYISYSDGITVEYVNFKSSAFWTVVPLSSSNILLRGLNLDCMNTPNRDGIDPVDCHDMTIYDCRIMAGDDGLCFKSSDPVGCYRIFVDDMMIQSLASGIKFGTDTYFCLKDAYIRGCTVKNVNRCGISLETVDGAAVENVIFERIDMTDVGAPVYLVVGDRNRLPRQEGIPERSGYIRNVIFRELRFEHPYPFSYTKNIREVMAVGQNEQQRIEDVTFEKCRFVLPGGFRTKPGCPVTIDKKYPEYDRHGLSAGSMFTVRYAKNFRVLDCDIVLESPDVRPDIAYFDYEE